MSSCRIFLNQMNEEALKCHVVAKDSNVNRMITMDEGKKNTQSSDYYIPAI
jgi:hypothetical protein